MKVLDNETNQIFADRNQTPSANMTRNTLTNTRGSNFTRTLTTAAVLAAGLLMGSTAMAQAPGQVPVQGTLYDSAGIAIDGPLAVDFVLYADAAGTVPLWSDTVNVNFVTGVFTSYLGAGSPIDTALFRDNTGIFVGITVDGDTEMPLYRLATAPFAGWADYAGVAEMAEDAATLDGSTLTEIEDGIIAIADSSYAPIGHSHSWGEITNIPADLADGDNVLTEAQVDAFVANNGYLTGSLSWGSITGIPADIADGDDVLTEADVDAMVADNGYQQRVVGTCPAGSSIRVVANDGGVTCETDDNTQLTESEVDAMVADNNYQTRVTGSCPAGNSIRAIASDGSVTCEADTDTNTQLTESQVDAFANNNGYQTRVSGTCPAGQSIRVIASNGTVTCEVDTDTNTQLTSAQVVSYVDASNQFVRNVTWGTCSTTGYVNNYDATFLYVCPTNQFMVGMGGVHSNSAEDRRFQFRCCTLGMTR